MSKKIKVGIVGFGNMGRSCAVALKAKGQHQIFIYDKDKKKIQKIKNFRVVQDSALLIGSSEVVILAIKPQDISNFLIQNKEHLLKKKPLIVSIAAGVSLSWLQAQLNKLRIIRVMPNLAAKVRKSISFISSGKFAKPGDLSIVKKIFSSAGEVVEIKEAYLNKVTGLSGSGPGYVFYFMESMYQNALKLGFSKNDAKKITVETFLGAATLAKTSKTEFKTLIDGVTSKNGTTEAALKVFNASGINKAIAKGIKNACQRAEKISQELT